MRPRIYLAGAIRDGRPDDIAWRERIISELGDKASWLNPLASKTYDPATKIWTMSGITPTASVIVPHDFWMVEHSDAIIFNLSALSEGYPNIGTLVEFGHATALNPRPLIYSVIDPNLVTNPNETLIPGVDPNSGRVQKMFGGLHPFLSVNSAIVFKSIDDLVSFLNSHLPSLSGDQPRFLGGSHA
jgi:hypothetical protein